MGEDEASQGTIARITALHVRTPLCAVGLHLSDIRHDGVGLLCRLPEPGNACKLGSALCNGGRGVYRGITAVDCIAVAVNGAMPLGDFAGQVVYRV